MMSPTITCNMTLISVFKMVVSYGTDGRPTYDARVWHKLPGELTIAWGHTVQIVFRCIYTGKLVYAIC